MRIATIVHQGQRHVGRLSADGLRLELFDIDGTRGALPLAEAAAAGAPLPALRGSVALADVQLIAPLPTPRRNLWCVGRNYHAHAKELQGSVFKDNAKAVDAWPIVFTKAPETVVGPGADVHLPGDAVSSQIDYEAELTIVIGKGGKNIGKVDAMGHIWGYTIVNDVTARDLQKKDGQWTRGKGFDTFCPVGPYEVPAEEIDFSQLSLETWLNGERRQQGSVSQLIFSLGDIIEFVTRFMTLEPGDLIATGTPEGVGPMQPGDAVTVKIEGLGTLTNSVTRE